MTYAQAVANTNKQHNVQENEDVKQTLQLILDKLIKQEALFTAFDEHIRKLEYIAQGATPKLKHSQNYGVECQWASAASTRTAGCP